ncbi:MAG: DUF433 domain-containing protein [bacterium]|nr:DUF433 domain-containing protein [bacterium]
MVDYNRHIARDPAICGGTPVIKGTRVTLRTVLASLAEGASVQDILADFPTLTEEDVRAVIAFAAVSAEEDIPFNRSRWSRENQARREHPSPTC